MVNLGWVQTWAADIALSTKPSSETESGIKLWSRPLMSFVRGLESSKRIFIVYLPLRARCNRRLSRCLRPSCSCMRRRRERHTPGWISPSDITVITTTTQRAHEQDRRAKGRKKKGGAWAGRQNSRSSAQQHHKSSRQGSCSSRHRIAPGGQHVRTGRQTYQPRPHTLGSHSPWAASSASRS